MAIAGYKATLKRGGTATAFTDVQLNRIGGSTSKVYSISTAAPDRTIFDRDTVPTFKSSAAGTTISSTNISNINYLFGKVTFKTTHTTSIVGAGSYIPVIDIAGAHSFSLNMAGDILDVTDFSSTGIRSRILGIRDVSLTVSRWENTTDKFFNDLILKQSSGTTLAVVEVRPTDDTTVMARGWFVVESNVLSGSVNDAESGEISMQIDASPSSRDNKTFTWSDI